MSKHPRLSVSPVDENAEEATESDSSMSSASSVSSSNSISKTDGSESPSSSSNTDSDSESSDIDTDDSSDAETRDRVEETFGSESETKPRPARYQCSICSNFLKSPESLRQHLRAHEGIKPYSCTWPHCGYRTARPGDIIKHIRVVHFKVPATRKGQLEKNGTVDERQESDFIKRDDQILGRAPSKRQNASNGYLSKMKCESNSVKANSAKRQAPSKHLPCYFNQLGLCNCFFSSADSRRTHYRIHLSIRPFSCAYPDCTDNYRAEARASVLWHIRTVHLGLPGKGKADLDGKESPDAKAYMAVDKELLNPCFTNLPNNN